MLSGWRAMASLTTRPSDSSAASAAVVPGSPGEQNPRDITAVCGAFNRAFNELAHPPEHVWIAYSGGLDSTVLLHLAAGQRNNGLFGRLSAIHVNHNIAADSTDWERHCRDQAAGLAVPLVVCQVAVGELVGGNLEQRARQSRYQQIVEQLAPGDLLLTAHHQRDQAETLLLQLFRGAGVRGTAAMGQLSSPHGVTQMRPLLEVTPEQLAVYAAHYQLQWVEDPSNQQLQHDRNYLRHRVMPVLRQRWPAIERVLGRSARLHAETSELVDELAAIDLAAASADGQSRSHPQTPSPTGVDDRVSLDCAALAQLSSARLNNLIRYWLKLQGYPVPSAVQLRELCNSLVFSRPERSPEFSWGGCQVYRYGARLFADYGRELSQLAGEQSWHLDRPLLFGESALQLSARRRTTGLRMSWQPEQPLSVRFRQGGETIQWHGHHHKLKKLLQEWRVPPRDRQGLPLIFNDQRLLAVPGYAVADSVRVAGDGVGWQLRWEPVSPKTEDQGEAL